jgi:hypothetical protein
MLTRIAFLVAGILTLVPLCSAQTLPPGRDPTKPAQPAAPADEKYFCPMKCEGDKTYDAAGRCPVCHMKLKPVPKAEPDLPVTLELVSPPQTSLKAGQTTTLNFSAKTEAPAKVLNDYDLVIATDDLQWAHHVQAAPDKDGKLPVRTEFQEPGPHSAILIASGNRVRPTGLLALTVPGVPRKPTPFPPLGSAAKLFGGYEVALSQSSVPIGKPVSLSFNITREGKPIEPSLSQARAMRLILLSDNFKEGAAVKAEPSQSGAPAFRVTIPAPGQYRALLMFEDGGEPRSGVCTLEAK